MHKKIGIIGGLSAESTVSYYLHITRTYIERFGDCGYPEIIIFSVNLENYRRWRSTNRWDLIVNDLTSAARNLQQAGADFALIATNTMHKVFDEVQSGTTLPLIHILDSTVHEIELRGVRTVGLLGTRYTMRETFYIDKLANNGIRALVPTIEDQNKIHRIIVDELSRGKILEESRQECLCIIDTLRQDGADGIILGCTELPLLLHPDDSEIPLFDTAILHAQVALDLAIRA
ncbi:MAG: amino acid racemase [Desulfobacula sp.]|jgi:aspartate racemase